jgi:hypothetical protein
LRAVILLTLRSTHIRVIVEGEPRSPKLQNSYARLANHNPTQPERFSTQAGHSARCPATHIFSQSAYSIPPWRRRLFLDIFPLKSGTSLCSLSPVFACPLTSHSTSAATRSCQSASDRRLWALKDRDELHDRAGEVVELSVCVDQFAARMRH